MIERTYVSTLAGDARLADLACPLDLDRLVPGDGAWEVELGFGKGKYLLRRSSESPERRFLGVEQAGAYARLFVERARRRGDSNWAALRGEALYLAAAVLPAAFAATVHVYFPDPWPKSRHQKRRLFDPETVDLVLGLLADGGRLAFATDFIAYGELVADILRSYPGLSVCRRERPWDEGPRTNYEAKYMLEGRPILRLEATLRRGPGRAALHPRGAAGVLAATAPRPE